jgi:mannose-6-phosphate isomerase-like protein (cupin superfamily)
VSDQHLRLLQRVARHRQTQLDEHDTPGGARDADWTEQRRRLQRAVVKTKERVAAAQKRRRPQART